MRTRLSLARGLFFNFRYPYILYPLGVATISIVPYWAVCTIFISFWPQRLDRPGCGKVDVLFFPAETIIYSGCTAWRNCSEFDVAEPWCGESKKFELRGKFFSTRIRSVCLPISPGKRRQRLLAHARRIKPLFAPFRLPWIFDFDQWLEFAIQCNFSGYIPISRPSVARWVIISFSAILFWNCMNNGFLLIRLFNHTAFGVKWSVINGNPL